MILLEGKLFFRRIAGILRAFYRTFVTAGMLRKLSKQKQDLAWNTTEVTKASSTWGKNVLRDLNLELVVEGSSTDLPAIYVGNHISYIDIIALLSIKHLCFVAKSEVAKWPIIGEATKAIGSIFVKRDSAKSRFHTAEAIGTAVKEDGKSICIFPEGTTSIQGKTWRRGVFKVAHDHDLLVQPIGFSYAPIRRAAYIDDDALIPHMFSLIRKEPTKVKLKYFQARKITDPDRDMKIMEAEIRSWADEELRKQQYFESPIGYL